MAQLKKDCYILEHVKIIPVICLVLLDLRCLLLLVQPGLIILNAWYGKFVTDTSRKHERAKVIDVTVPLQCLVKDSKLILTEATKVKSAPHSIPAVLPDAAGC